MSKVKTDVPELKPCPFCGAEACATVEDAGRLSEGWLVQCPHGSLEDFERGSACGAGPIVCGDTLAEAAARWNKRTTRTDWAAAAAAAAEAEDIAPCPFCGGAAKATPWPAVAGDVDEPYWTVSCEGCPVSAMTCGDDRAEAVAAWNHRTTRTDGAAALVYACDHALMLIEQIMTLQDDSIIESLACQAQAELSAALGRARREHHEGGEA